MTSESYFAKPVAELASILLLGVLGNIALALRFQNGARFEDNEVIPIHSD